MILVGATSFSSHDEPFLSFLNVSNNKIVIKKIAQQKENIENHS